MSETATDELLPEFQGFFDNAGAGRLAFPCCQSCGKFHWYPMPRCPHCQRPDIEWRQVAGQGELFSFTRVMHLFDKSRVGTLPYIVALVTFADAPGVRFVTNIIGEGTDRLQIGQALDPVFAEDKNGRPMVDFQVARS
jgi:uncharacterized protein